MSKWLILLLVFGSATAQAAPELCRSKPSKSDGRAMAVHELLCGSGGRVDGELALDVPDATELERFANATHCVGLRPNMDSDVLVFVTWCVDDVAAFDDAHAHRMLDKLGFPKSMRVAADWDHAPAWRAKMKELAADPTWKTLIEARNKGAEAWAAAVKANEDVYKQSRELRACTAGNAPKALQLLQQYLAKSKPTTLDAVRTALEDPVGYEVYYAVLACMAADEQGGEAFVLAFQPPQWEGGMSSADDFKVSPQAGPHLAGAAAMAVELVKLQKTDERFAHLNSPVRLPSHKELIEPVYRANPKGVSHFHPARGTIAALAPQKDGRQLVTFKTETIVRDVGTCTTTNKINRINADGTIEYWQDCKVTGQEKEKVTPHAIYVAKDLAAGLKPGRMVSYFWQGGSFDKGPSDGTIHTIWADAKRKAIAGWAGTSW
jgi:hypothetical protein